MDNKTIDNIVWWIPFKKLRNSLREYLLEINNFNDKLLEINNKINILESSVYNNYVDLYTKMKRLTPQSHINFVEIHLAEHCNLNCYSCDHFSQLAKEEYYDIEIFENDIRRLYELTNGLINRFQLMGGEPLLNKNCKGYFYIIRKYFKNSSIWLITNGILLPKQDESFWIYCKENNVEIHPTKYPININWENILELCNKYGIILSFYNDTNIQKESYKAVLNIEGKSDPFNNFINCFIANNCLFLNHGKLFSCGLVSNIRHFNDYFNKNLEVTEHDYIDIYKAKDYNEILQFLAKPMPFCRYCDITKWHSIGKWETSKRNIEEYID
ncbi:radical SAM protein [Brachyspira hampsonii]|uniref:Radical SAM protein n=1 Tax=Brachyspira hampsonii TaxID=1287055 RepID=A0A1E5NIM0_9SPIR|nr:radical SAM protein [Brachyspira hampsonii]OEJ15974.1 radical SAM protein [Brachyspira hampsonii]